jgi:multidrug efflux pump subunit AcrA (membrane-fusion protein)
MFAVATFRSRKSQSRIVVPDTAVIRLQDRDWVFRKDSDKQFHRVEVHTAGQSLDQMQQIQDGVKPGDQVVANALEFSTSVAEQGK